MVHCPKCWTKNEDDAKYSVKCGANLKEGSCSSRTFDSMDECEENIGKRAEEWGKDFPKRIEKECFDLPHGSTIIGFIIGIIILIGLSSLAGIDLEIWSFLIIIFGLLIFGGAVYSLLHRR